MRKGFLLFTLLIIFILPLAALHAETRYITDDLKIPLRDGTSSRHKILKMVKSGTAVEFIVKDKETGYSLIKVGKTEGWVPDSKLSRQPGAARRLEQKTKAYDKLKKENAQLKKQLAELREGSADKSATVQSLSSDLKALQAQYDKLRNDTANVVAINEQNRTLAAQADTLTTENNALREENRILKDRSDKDWFLRGAGVIIIGIILGLIIPRIRLRKRDSWGSGY